MTGGTFDLLVDLFAIGLLGATAFYCFLLDRRLRAMREGQDGLKDTIQHLNEACDRAAISVRNLSGATEKVDEELERRLNRARSLADELGMILEAGNNLADRLTQASGEAIRNVEPTAEPRGLLGEVSSPVTPPLQDTVSPVQARPIPEPRGAMAEPSQIEKLNGGMTPELEQQLLDTLRQVR